MLKPRIDGKSVILFMTHFCSRHVLKEYLDIKARCSPRYDVILLCETSQADFQKVALNSSVSPFYFDFKAYRSLGYRNWQSHRWKKEGIVPGNLDFLVLGYFLENRHYDYYWVVEYDVRFTGKWDRFFDNYLDSNVDLLTTTLRRYKEDPSWFWWFSVSSPDNTSDSSSGSFLTKSELIACFMPVARLSRKACIFLDRMYKLGWSGHHEVIVPTLLARNGFSIEDIGGIGEFVGPGNINRFYTGRLNTRPLLPRTFRYRPAMRHPGWRRNMLWHPIKEYIPWATIWRQRFERAQRHLGNLISKFPPGFYC